MLRTDPRLSRGTAARGGGPSLDVQLFELAWYREFIVPGRSHLSDPATWGLALAYDQAVVSYDFDELVVIDASGPMTGTVEICLMPQDSSDGLTWCDLLADPVEITTTGSGRVTVPAPFGAHLRVVMDVNYVGGFACLGLAHGQVGMTLRRREARRSGGLQRASLPYPAGVTAAVEARQGGCGGGCGGGCSAGDCGCGG